MKQYIKPTAEVVELSVKENIAALPKALDYTTVQKATIGSKNVYLTTYNLASQQTSNNNQPNVVQ